jgi:hypothetical protein
MSETRLQRILPAIAAALYRVCEWAPQHVTDAAWGLGPINTDAGAALNALREAAGFTVKIDNLGFPEFHTVETMDIYHESQIDPPDPAPTPAPAGEAMSAPEGYTLLRAEDYSALQDIAGPAVAWAVAEKALVAHDAAEPHGHNFRPKGGWPDTYNRWLATRKPLAAREKETRLALLAAARQSIMSAKSDTCLPDTTTARRPRRHTP